MFNPEAQGSIIPPSDDHSPKPVGYVILSKLFSRRHDNGNRTCETLLNSPDFDKKKKNQINYV